MANKQLEGPFKTKVQKLAELLQEDEPDLELVKARYSTICSRLGPQFGVYRRQVVAMIGEEHLSKLAEATTFKLSA